MLIVCKMNLPRTCPKVEQLLLDAFGGFTVAVAHGAWKAPSGEIIREPMAVYEVALRDRPRERGLFTSYAKAAAKAMDQQAVYVVHGHTAKIVDL